MHVVVLYARGLRHFEAANIQFKLTNSVQINSLLCCINQSYTTYKTLEVRVFKYLETHLHAVSRVTHWGRVTHICVRKLTIVGSDNGLSPGRRQAVILTNAGVLLIGLLRKVLLVYLLSKLIYFHWRKWIGKCLRPFCLGTNLLTTIYHHVANGNAFCITSLFWGSGICFLVRMNQLLNKQSSCHWFWDAMTLMWRHHNVMITIFFCHFYHLILHCLKCSTKIICAIVLYHNPHNASVPFPQNPCCRFSFYQWYKLLYKNIILHIFVMYNLDNLAASTKCYEGSPEFVGCYIYIEHFVKALHLSDVTWTLRCHIAPATRLSKVWWSH